MAARINRIALSGWRGIPYLEVQLDDGPLTALIGTPGAGKSTVAMLLCYALMPDRRAMDIKFISGVQDAHRAGVDQVAGRVDPLVGFAYVALDMQDHRDRRVVAGLHVRVADARAEFTCLEWQDLPADWQLQDCLRRLDGDDEIYPDLNDLGAALAARGINLRSMRSVREYGELLFQTGVLPTDYSDLGDRSLYARLVESTFQGGLSREVAGKIKEYMLPAATRLPESVDRLQKCADTVMRTHGALAEAERQLKLLQATYGLGRSIVTNAIASLMHRKGTAQADLDAARRSIGEQREALERLSASTKEAEAILETAAGTKEAIEAEFVSKFEEKNRRQLELKGRSYMLAGEVTTAKDQLRHFLDGRKAWRAAAADESVELRYSTLEKRLQELIEANARDRHRAEDELENCQQQLRTLESGLAESASAQLADALGVESLAEAFEHIEETEARKLELALGGLVEGVVGCDLADLARLSDDPGLPDTFWIRNRLPEAEEIHEVGDWYASPVAGGYIVASKRRRLALGRQARERHIERLKLQASEVEMLKLKPLQQLKAALEQRLTGLHQKKEIIDKYLAAPDAEEALRAAVETATAIAADAQREFEEMAAEVRSLTTARDAKVAEVQREIDRLELQIREAGERSKDARAEVDRAETTARHAGVVLEAATDALAHLHPTLGRSSGWLQREATGVPAMRAEEYIAKQTRALAHLGQALQDEPPERLAFLNAATAEDPLSLAAIWEPLLEIVSDRISVEGLEADGADLIAEMTQRRQDLSGQLDVDRSQMRAEAKSLYASIATEIRKQERRIARLSAFGETLRFGNVTGMRIVAHHRDDLLEHLQNLARQIDLFAGGTDKPLDAHLAELFNKAIGSSYSGSELLDYRTYMDLTIEARRNGKWDLASGLSGGESIGGGLAFSLMLARSLAQRSGDARALDFTPTFVIDEVQRLDAEGQRLIVEFGRAQNIQVLVTALSLEHKFPCTIYVMARHYMPAEQVVARRVLVRPKAQELADA